MFVQKGESISVQCSWMDGESGTVEMLPSNQVSLANKRLEILYRVSCALGQRRLFCPFLRRFDLRIRSAYRN